MPVVSITRLRVRSWRYVPIFFVQALRCARQAAQAHGNVGAKVLRDANNVFWTGTSWTDEQAMKSFMHASPHGPVMRKLLDWCDEASLVHWAQADGVIPPWSDAHVRLQRDGRTSKVRHPSPAHVAFSIAPPTGTATLTLRADTPRAS